MGFGTGGNGRGCGGGSPAASAGVHRLPEGIAVRRITVFHAGRASPDACRARVPRIF